MINVASEEHRRPAQKFKQMYSLYRQNQDLISVGAYQKGSDARIDEAILFYPRLQQFLRQDVSEACDFESSLQQLQALMEPISD